MNTSGADVLEILSRDIQTKLKKTQSICMEESKEEGKQKNQEKINALLKSKINKNVKVVSKFEFDIDKHMDLTKEETQNLARIKKFENYEWLLDVKTMGAGETFGELALQSDGTKRAATIKCDSTCYFATLHKTDYIRFLKKQHNQTIQKDISFFSSLPFFYHWTVN